jgi:tRNA(fMet)-specific endonuclease VapC
MILLDTDHLTLLQRGDPYGAPLKRRLDALPAHGYGTTIISYEEQMRGWMAFVRAARTIPQQIDGYARLMTHLDSFRTIIVVPFDGPAAVEFQRLQSCACASARWI